VDDGRYDAGDHEGYERANELLALDGGEGFPFLTLGDSKNVKAGFSLASHRHDWIGRGVRPTRAGVKYNRHGGRILVSAEKHDHVVQICVGNNGPGIPPARAPHVFERFYRARGDEQTPGHGLGLSIARELARAHGASQSAIGLD
jgi:Histidine kinase-, DNA gyrase B-, and HSP90-like ATPase